MEILAAVIVVLLLFVMVIYNKIILTRNAVERAWALVITYEREKNNTLPRLEKLVKKHKEFEASTLEKIVSLRNGVKQLDSKQIDSSKLENLQEELNTLLKSINVTFEAYPNLKSYNLYKDLMKEISSQQENISAALRIFNQNVENFNNTIMVFPNALVNDLICKKEKIKPFSDSKASEGFEYKFK